LEGEVPQTLTHGTRIHVLDVSILDGALEQLPSNFEAAVKELGLYTIAP
jgi:hypothetical protein